MTHLELAAKAAEEQYELNRQKTSWQAPWHELTDAEKLGHYLRYLAEHPSNAGITAMWKTRVKRDSVGLKILIKAYLMALVEEKS